MDLLDEIKEDLRNEQAKKFWQNYGRYVIAAVVALVLGTGITSGYKQYSQQQAAKDAGEFSTAMQLANDKKRDEALQKLSSLALDGTSGYKTLALFSTANLALKEGKPADAASAYDQVANNESIDPLYRGLATIYGTIIRMDLPDADLAGLDAKLQPLTAAGKPWRFSALELQGLIAMQQGNKEKAKNIFDRIAADAEAPQVMKARVQRQSEVLSY